MINRAWAWRGGSEWTLEEVPVPDPKHGEVLIKIGGVGFCGSEKEHEWASVEDLTPDQLSSLPWIGGHGHEVAGVIEEVGEGVSTCKPGDRVTLLHLMGCRKCLYCTSGRENNCPYVTERVTLRGYADYISVPSALAYHVPDEMPMEEAAMVEPAAIGVHVIEGIARVRPGETVLVFGVGQIGSFCAQAAKVSGARVIAVDDRELARRSALDLGFDVVIDPSRQDMTEIVKSETGGTGPDAIVEVAGRPEYYSQFVDMLGRSGRIVMVGNTFTEQVTLDLRKLQSKEASLVTSKACVGADYVRALDLVRWGKLRLNWMDGTAIATYRMEDFPRARQEWMDLENTLYVIMP